MVGTEPARTLSNSACEPTRTSGTAITGTTQAKRSGSPSYWIWMWASVCGSPSFWSIQNRMFSPD